MHITRQPLSSMLLCAAGERTGARLQELQRAPGAGRAAGVKQEQQQHAPVQAPGQEPATADDGKNPFEYLTLAPFAGDRSHQDGAGGMLRVPQKPAQQE